MTLSLNGTIHYLDPQSGKISKNVHGHQKGITSLAKLENETFFSGSYDGRILAWNDPGEAKPLPHFQHSNQVIAFTVQGNDLYSAGMDDFIKGYSLDRHAYVFTTFTRVF